MPFEIKYTVFFEKKSKIKLESLKNLMDFKSKKIEKISGLSTRKIREISKAMSDDKPITLTNSEHKKLIKAIKDMYRL